MLDVTLAADLLTLVSASRGGSAELAASDFPTVFAAIALLITLAILSFRTLR